MLKNYRVQGAGAGAEDMQRRCAGVQVCRCAVLRAAGAGAGAGAGAPHMCGRCGGAEVRRCRGAEIWRC